MVHMMVLVATHTDATGCNVIIVLVVTVVLMVVSEIGMTILLVVIV